MSDPITRLNAALEGRYQIERELGEGGMATVYLADDLRHERKVALKVLKPELAAVVGADRFLAEIKTTANLQHPHILPLFDSGEADGFLYYVMPYVEGESLRERLDREHQLPVDEAVQIATNVTEALDYAHKQGVIHRDIKPANILLQAGKPVVSDFGIALAVSAGGGGRLTETGLSLGTPHYMSPEQAAGDQEVDPRSDVYALACVLYEMLAGEPPFSAPTAQATLAKILTADPPSITMARRTVPAHVGAALAKALEKLPADRFTSAAQLAAALRDEGFTYEARVRTSAAPTPAPAELGPDRDRPWLRDGRTLAGMGLVGALAALAVWGWLRPAPPTPVYASYLHPPEGPMLPLGEVLISPDGSRLAVVGYLDRRPIVWRNTEEEGFRPLPGTEAVEYASFSPDGRSLAFGTNTTGTIQRISLSGGAPQPIATLPRADIGGIHWEDGTIVYTLGGGAGLFRVPATGGEPEELLDVGVSVRNPWLLPGSRGVLFTDTVSSSTLLYDLADDSVRVLLPGALDARYVETGHLLYADVSGALWAVSFDLGTGETRGDPTSIFGGIATPNAFYARYSISRNGTLVYGSGGVGSGSSGGGELVIVGPDLRPRAVSLSARPIQIFDPAWSPNGRFVAYAGQSESDADPDIYTYDVESESTPRKLTFEGSNRSPRWSPDGTRVVFASARAGATQGWDLFVKDLDDDAPAARILVLTGDQSPSQWPRENLLFFSSGDTTGRQGLFVLDPTTPEPIPRPYLSQSDLDDIQLAPAGDLVVYSDRSASGPAIFVRSFPEAGAPEQVSLRFGQQPRWSGDGRSVYYWLMPAAPYRLEAARVERGPPFAVIRRDTILDEGPYELQNGWDYHPESERMVLTRPVGPEGSEGERSVERFLLVTNFFDVLNRRMRGEN